MCLSAYVSLYVWLHSHVLQTDTNLQALGGVLSTAEALPLLDSFASSCWTLQSLSMSETGVGRLKLLITLTPGNMWSVMGFADPELAHSPD